MSTRACSSAASQPAVSPVKGSRPGRQRQEARPASSSKARRSRLTGARSRWRASRSGPAPSSGATVTLLATDAQAACPEPDLATTRVKSDGPGTDRYVLAPTKACRPTPQQAVRMESWPRNVTESQLDAYNTHAEHDARNRIPVTHPTSRTRPAGGSETSAPRRGPWKRSRRAWRGERAHSAAARTGPARLPPRRLR